MKINYQTSQIYALLQRARETRLPLLDSPVLMYWEQPNQSQQAVLIDPCYLIAASFTQQIGGHTTDFRCIPLSKRAHECLHGAMLKAQTGQLAKSCPFEFEVRHNGVDYAVSGEFTFTSRTKGHLSLVIGSATFWVELDLPIATGLDTVFHRVSSGQY